MKANWRPQENRLTRFRGSWGPTLRRSWKGRESWAPWRIGPTICRRDLSNSTRRPFVSRRSSSGRTWRWRSSSESSYLSSSLSSLLSQQRNSSLAIVVVLSFRDVSSPCFILLRQNHLVIISCNIFCVSDWLEITFIMWWVVF